ncbi:MAG: hypothetical protein GY772_31380 [bacterium]|nr:hypothetical protein [bacterium]
MALGREELWPGFFQDALAVAGAERKFQWHRGIDALLHWPPPEWRAQEYWPTMKEWVTHVWVTFRDIMNAGETCLAAVVLLSAIVMQEAEEWGAEVLLAPVWNVERHAYDARLKFCAAGRLAQHYYRRPTQAQLARGLLPSALRRARGEPVQMHQ